MEMSRDREKEGSRKMCSISQHMRTAGKAGDVSKTPSGPDKCLQWPALGPWAIVCELLV